VTRLVLSLCRVCGRLPEAIVNTGYCFGCWPGGPVTPPPCLLCGSLDYYNTGKCRRCHLYGAAEIVESCPDCLAWGTVRKHKWYCLACLGWRKRFPVAECRCCSATVPVNAAGYCRLCLAQARFADPATRTTRRARDAALADRVDIAEANRHGQQLFLANLVWHKGSSRAAVDAQQRRDRVRARTAEIEQATGRLAIPFEQPALFPDLRDYSTLTPTDMPWPSDTALLHMLWQLADARAERLGWSWSVTERTRTGLRVILGLQPLPGTMIRTSHLEVLTEFSLVAKHVAAVLDEAGLLFDDKQNTLAAWFDRLLLGLPEAMIAEMRIWFDVVAHGRTDPPRCRPRANVTIHCQASWAVPILRDWAAAGHTSLREIAREDVTAAITGAEHPNRAAQGLRSVFRILKQNHAIFADPAARIPVPAHPSREPLPANTAAIAALLDTDNPARAAVAALAAFHALRTGQIRALQLTDVAAGRLRVEGRDIPLAEPVQQRVDAYIAYRNTRWPKTANPHLFINYRSAMELRDVGVRWVKLLLGPGLTCRSIREDRILAEALASRGDPRRLHDMFGLSIHASERYTRVVDHPTFEDLDLED